MTNAREVYTTASKWCDRLAIPYNQKETDAILDKDYPESNGFSPLVGIVVAVRGALFLREVCWEDKAARRHLAIIIAKSAAVMIYGKETKAVSDVVQHNINHLFSDEERGVMAKTTARNKELMIAMVEEMIAARRADINRPSAGQQLGNMVLAKLPHRNVVRRGSNPDSAYM